MSTGMPRRLPTFWQLAWTLRRVRGDRHGINQGSGEGVRATQKEIFVYKPRLMPVLMDPISFFVPDRILRRSVRNFVPRGLRWADSRPAKIYCKLADNRPQEDDDPTDSNFCCLSQGHYSNDVVALPFLGVTERALQRKIRNKINSVRIFSFSEISCFYNLRSLEQFIGGLGANWSFQRRALDWPNCSVLAHS